MNRHWRLIFLFAPGLFLVSALFWPLLKERHLFDNDKADSLSHKRKSTLAVNSIEFREKTMDDTVWAKEMLAQKCGRIIEDFWDALNGASNKFRVMAKFPFGNILLSHFAKPQALPQGINLFSPLSNSTNFTEPAWRDYLAKMELEGWMLDNVEFRHIRFVANESLAPLHSTYSFSANLTQQKHNRRAAIQGELLIAWIMNRHNEVSIGGVDAQRLTIKTQDGNPGFSLIMDSEISPVGNSTYADPLILYDLNGDGLSEIILAAKNCVYRNLGKGSFAQEDLCRHSPGSITTAMIADFNKDGAADFLCAKSEGLVLFSGSLGGAFENPGELVWPAKLRLKNAMVMTCGDIDHDGDLDVFIGQYRVPTLGQMLKPQYYDANDGFSSYLLRNDGSGHFADITESSGLGEKRRRRIYSSSFVDLFNSGHLDLVVISDFAGVDIYRNDGKGNFTDVTQSSVNNSRAFGMAHAMADLNVDGRLDLLMIGMPSPTADRLEALGLRRPNSKEDHSMRSRMAYGNRLYLAQPEGDLKQTSMNEFIAKTGWSWGCTVFEVDNDGFPDVFIANGLESKQSVRDYEPEFWLHDIYIDESVDDSEATSYFLSKFNRTRGQGWSYGGYEKNRLYLNQNGMSFLEIGHLFGVALEKDSRNVVSDDLDGDGRMDLLVSTLETWPTHKHTLRVYRNTTESKNHWIGFRFREEKGGLIPVGIRVTIHCGSTKAVRDLVTGDSHRSQHANAIHFGLGNHTQVDYAEIRLPGRKTITYSKPAVDRYHSISSTP